MSILRFRIAQLAMAVFLGIALWYAPRPPGFLDHTVWPIAYGFAALSSLALAIRPKRIFMHAWASLVISIGLIRGVTLFIEPTVPGLRWASVSSNFFLASLAYVTWAGWKDRLPGDGGEMITLPISTVETLLIHPTPEEQIAEHERVSGVLEYDSEPTPEQQSEYRLPRVPGLN